MAMLPPGVSYSWMSDILKVLFGFLPFKETAFKLIVPQSL